MNQQGEETAGLSLAVMHPAVLPRRDLILDVQGGALGLLLLAEAALCRAAYPNATQLSHALEALDDYEHDKKDPRGEER